MAGQVAGSHLQNTSNPNPTGATKKSSQILQKQARYGEISTKSREILTRSGYIWWDLARSSQTQQFLAKNAYFRKNLVFGENFPVSGKIFQFPAKFSRFLQEFPVFDKNSRFWRRFFQILMPFLIPETDLTRSMLTITKNRTDRFF